VAIGANTVLGRAGADIVAAQVIGAQIAANTVDNANLAQMVALSVKVNATAVTATPSDVSAAGVADSVLLRSGSSLTFALIGNANVGSGTLNVNRLAAQAANTVVANATAGSASPTAFAVGTNSVLGRVAGNIVAAQLVTAQIAVNQVTNAVLAQMAANTVKVNATAALADPQDVSIGTNAVLGRVAGNIVAAALVRQQLAAESSGEGVGWTKVTGFTASGAPGTSVDVTIFSSNSPACRITFGQLRLSVAFAGTCALRTATGGGGSVVLPSATVPTSTFDTTAVGRRNDNAGATATLAAGSTLVLRIDQSCTGEAILEMVNM
jgi:hypothetical protein